MIQRDAIEVTDNELAKAFAIAFRGQFSWSRTAEENKCSWRYKKFSRWNQLRDEFGIITMSELRRFAQSCRENDLSPERLTRVLEIAKVLLPGF